MNSEKVIEIVEGRLVAIVRGDNVQLNQKAYFTNNEHESVYISKEDLFKLVKELGYEK